MKKLAYTFSAILVLLAGFLGVWWHQSYQKDAAVLRETVENEVNRLVSDEFVYPTLQAFMHHEQSVREGMILWRDANTSVNGGLMRIKKIRTNAYGQPETAEITIIRNSRPIASSHFYYDKKLIALDKLPETVRDSMYRKFGINLRPVFFQLRSVTFNDQYTTAPEEPMTVRIKYISSVGASHSRASFVVTDYVPQLLLGLLPEFLFGFILFGATGFAFLSAYRNLNEQREQLRAKDILVANVAHELKTPIATVGVALEALSLFGADTDPARRREYVAISQTELRRLDAMADRAIDSLQEGDLSQRLVLGNVDLTVAIHEAWRSLALRHHLPESALQLTTYGTTLAEVDAHYWHHLVYNLLDNACKYGGRPLVVDVNLTSQVGAHVLTVADNGPGVPAAERHKIFDRFYRIARPSYGHAVKGHGLGLSFVRQVATAHGGGVEVDNVAGRGARFTVRIPSVR
ncbi:sensor histidine kinase [Neolewinella antarctica]|uniref:histidine kinase n=1 Tax=Neolewinella antarctica TaxID=442734 RepID=A0ABX0X7K5_9BACT|nr:HAMP domain-containing sensor histidine kinase [Neolewinella antarctica]NJC24988.1 signal transduction histidine kinase [Neolewinella antarctica]